MEEKWTYLQIQMEVKIHKFFSLIRKQTVSQLMKITIKIGANQLTQRKTK